MTPTILYIVCLLIGAATGLRTMTGIALVAIAAQTAWPHLNHLHLQGTGLGFLAQPLSMYIFGLLAIGEWIADKLPGIPPRVQAGPLIARLVFGGFCGSALAFAAGQSWPPSAVIGAVSALVAAFAGYWLRRSITSRGVKDPPIALLEDSIAILVALFAVTRF